MLPVDAAFWMRAKMPAVLVASTEPFAVTAMLPLLPTPPSIAASMPMPVEKTLVDVTLTLPARSARTGADADSAGAGGERADLAAGHVDVDPAGTDGDQPDPDCRPLST